MRARALTCAAPSRSPRSWKSKVRSLPRVEGLVAGRVGVGDSAHLECFRVVVDPLEQRERVLLGTAREGLPPCTEPRRSRMEHRVPRRAQASAMRLVGAPRAEERRRFSPLRGHDPALMQIAYTVMVAAVEPTVAAVAVQPDGGAPAAGPA